MQHSYFSKINQPGRLLLLFSHRDVQNNENEKKFLGLEIAKTNRGSQFRVGENGSGPTLLFMPNVI